MTLILAASILALLATIPAIETVASISALIGIELGTSFEDLSLLKNFLTLALSFLRAESPS